MSDPDLVGIIFYFKTSSSPMMIEMLAVSVHDFIRDHVIPTFETSSGVLRFKRSDMSGLTGEIRMDQVAGWQIIERNKEAWQK